MKKILALLLACLLPVLTACGAESDAPAGNGGTKVLTAEELPESCRRWFDIAAVSGAAEGDSKLPTAENGQDSTSDIFGVHMPDGSYVDLILQSYQTEGVTLKDFSNGGARVESSEGRLAWDGEVYDAFTIRAEDCAVPNLMPVSGGLLRLDISGDCTINGGGEPCFVGFDCVLITGDGTLTFETLGISCGGDRFNLPTLMVDGDVTVICPDLELHNNGSVPVYAQLGGSVYTDRMETQGQLLAADGLLLARQVNGAAGGTFQGGVALLDEYDGAAAEIVLSGGAVYLNGAFPAGTVIEGGAGALSAAGLGSLTVHTYDAVLRSIETDGSAYYQTAFSEDWAPEDGGSVVWNSLCAEQVESLCWFGGTLELTGAALTELLPWGALHLELTGENSVSGELGGTSLLLTGSGSLTANKAGLWGWGAVTRPVLVIRDGASLTVTGGEELSMGSNAEQEGLLLVEDGTLECSALWLQNAALVVRGGTVHVSGDCSIEMGSVTVEGGTLILDNGLWLGEGDVTLTGGRIVTPSGEEGLCLDKGKLHLDGGTVEMEGCTTAAA